MHRLTGRRLATFHMFATAVWLVLTIPTLLWWRETILWVALMSVWANVASHFGAWQAARAEVAAETNGATDG